MALTKVTYFSFSWYENTRNIVTSITPFFLPHHHLPLDNMEAKLVYVCPFFLALMVILGRQYSLLI